MKQENSPADTIKSLKGNHEFDHSDLPKFQREYWAYLATLDYPSIHQLLEEQLEIIQLQSSPLFENQEGRLASLQERENEVQIAKLHLGSIKYYLGNAVRLARAYSDLQVKLSERTIDHM